MVQIGLQAAGELGNTLYATFESNPPNPSARVLRLMESVIPTTVVENYSLTNSTVFLGSVIGGTTLGGLIIAGICIWRIRQYYYSKLEESELEGEVIPLSPDSVGRGVVNIYHGSIKLEDSDSSSSITSNLDTSYSADADPLA